MTNTNYTQVRPRPVVIDLGQLKKAVAQRQASYQSLIDQLIALRSGQTPVPIENLRQAVIDQSEVILLDIMRDLTIILSWRLDTTDYQRKLVEDFNHYLTDIRSTVQTVVQIERAV